MTPDHDPQRWQQPTGEDRLFGLGLILVGVLGFGVVYLLWMYAPSSMPAPPGLPQHLLPIASPLNCILPATAVGSSLLVLQGLRRLFLPD